MGRYCLIKHEKRRLMEQRTIKFRAWRHAGLGGDPYASGLMLYDKKPGDCFCWRAEGQDLDIMEYIGIDDRDGTPIFENDILELPNGVDMLNAPKTCLYRVVWRRTGFSAKRIPCGSEQVECLPLFWKQNECEVVGNAWETPELMKGTA